MRPRRWIPLASGAQMLALAAGAATNILYARLLSPAAIGELAISVAIGTAVVLLADSGLELLLTRELAQRSREPSEVVGVLVGALPVLVLAWWVLLYAGSLVIHQVWHSVGSTWPHAVLVLEFALAFAIFQVTLTLCQGFGLFERRSAAVAANGLVTTLLTAVALPISASLPWAIHATVLAYFAVAALVLYPILRRSRFKRPRVAEVWQLMRVARPIWVNSAITFSGGAADVLLAATVLPLASVGYYRILKAIATMFLAPFTALLPLFYSHFAMLARPDQARLYTRIRLGAVGAITALLVASAPFFAKAIQLTFGERFATKPAVLLAIIIAGGLAFSHNLLGYVATANGLFRIPLVINGAVTVVFFSAAPLLATQVGLTGFVIGSVTANVVGLMLAACLTRTLVFTRAGTLALWPVAAFAGSIGVALWLWGLPMWFGTPIGIVAALAWGVGIGSAVTGRQVLSGMRRPLRAAR
jgi:O-antigen/teichoic acid export membrane protein